MKILFLIREDYLKKSGGDTFQALKTKEYLEKYEDVSIDISHTVDNIDLSKYEIIHIFNIQIVNFAYDLVKQCKKYSKKVFLSPIMWDMSDGMYASYYFKYFTNFNCFNKFKFVRKIFDFVMLKHKNKIKYILSQCDCILPNSTEEDNYLKRKYKVNYKSVIVPNCIDIKLKPIKSVYLDSCGSSVDLIIYKKRYHCYNCNKIFTGKLNINTSNGSISNKVKIQIRGDLLNYNLSLKYIAEKNRVSMITIENEMLDIVSSIPKYVVNLPRVISFDEFKADTIY